MAEDIVQAIDNPAAVRMADEALAKILEQVQRDAMKFDPVFSAKETKAIFEALADWLVNHPAVEDALELTGVDLIEDGGETALDYSDAFTVVVNGDADDFCGWHPARIARKRLH